MLHGLKGQTTTRLRDYALAFEDLIASFMLELSKARPRRAEVIAAFCKATFEHDPSVVMECARRYAALDFAGHDDPLMLLHLRLIEGISSRHSRGSPRLSDLPVCGDRDPSIGKGPQPPETCRRRARLRHSRPDNRASHTRGATPRDSAAVPDQRILRECS
jgi:hypothetical protein